MDKFIRTYPMLEGTACKTLIETYQASKNKEKIANFFTPQFTQVNLNELDEKGYQKFTQLLCYKVLVFPPTWQYPHIGMPVKSGSPKYIMSTYLHYN